MSARIRRELGIPAAQSDDREELRSAWAECVRLGEGASPA